jgi:actin-like ATPase involved in cell morphogenesis
VGLLRTLYFRFDENIARLSDPARGEDLAIPPLVAIRTLGARRQVAAVGEGARALADCSVVNPFGHARLVMAEAEVFESLLRYMLNNLNKRLKLVKPRMVLHPLRRLETEISDVEAKALRDSAMAAGAWTAAVHVGHELTQAELEGFSFEYAATVS